MAKKKTPGKPAPKPVSKKQVSVSKSKSKPDKKATVVDSTAVALIEDVFSIDQNEILRTIDKGWATKGTTWIKKFDLGNEDPQAVLAAKLRYGKISFNDL